MQSEWWMENLSLGIVGFHIQIEMSQRIFLVHWLVKCCFGNFYCFLATMGDGMENMRKWENFFCQHWRWRNSASEILFVQRRYIQLKWFLLFFGNSSNGILNVDTNEIDSRRSACFHVTHSHTKLIPISFQTLEQSVRSRDGGNFIIFATNWMEKWQSTERQLIEIQSSNEMDGWAQITRWFHHGRVMSLSSVEQLWRRREWPFEYGEENGRRRQWSKWSHDAMLDGQLRSWQNVRKICYCINCAEYRTRTGLKGKLESTDFCVLWSISNCVADYMRAYAITIRTFGLITWTRVAGMNRAGGSHSHTHHINEHFHILMMDYRRTYISHFIHACRIVLHIKTIVDSDLDAIQSAVTLVHSAYTINRVETRQETADRRMIMWWIRYEFDATQEQTCLKCSPLRVCVSNNIHLFSIRLQTTRGSAKQRKKKMNKKLILNLYNTTTTTAATTISQFTAHTHCVRYTRTETFNDIFTPFHCQRAAVCVCVHYCRRHAEAHIRYVCGRIFFPPFATSNWFEKLS